jgi:hypothetical protein
MRFVSAKIDPCYLERFHRDNIRRHMSERDREMVSRRGLGNMPIQRCKNPGEPTGINVIDQPIYDTVSFAAAAAMAKTLLFQTPQSGTKFLNQTNMVVQGQLQNPQSLTISSLEVYIANNTIPVDLNNLLLNVSFTLQKSNKPWFQSALVRLTAGMGAIVTAAAQLGTSGAAQDLKMYSTSNGIPDPRAVYWLTQPITIGAGENFSVILNPEVAFSFAVAGGATIGVGTTIQVHLNGVLSTIVS